ncbi:MAG: sulfatase-like hydrolase/transferase [Acidobacteriota bacterium]|nr:sulfatase-like hydrolase/transferase [Acidobacteriota bacterium]
MGTRPNFITHALHLFILVAFAIAQPVFDLLSSNAEFFVARQSKPIDIILLILIVCLLLPLLLIPLEAIAALVGRQFQKWVHGILVALLLAAICLQILKLIPGVPGAALVIGALCAGSAISVVYSNFHLAQTYVSVLSPAILIFASLFLLDSQIYKIVFEVQDTEVTYPDIDATAPVVMIVFDEFPLISLLDENRQIDGVRYPNFAALARESHWFRNATTVSEGTLISIPAMLNGLYPNFENPRLPILSDHPHNLFTLMGGSYDLHTLENSTQLSPEKSFLNRQTLAERMSALLSDLTIVYLHLLLPADLVSDLSRITESWKDFRSPNTEERKRWEDFETDWSRRQLKFLEFVDSIHDTGQPTLHFFHSMLPHASWKYLPSGKLYTLYERPGVKGVIGPNNVGEDVNRWRNDDWLVTQGHQRHLLQVGFVDKLLGVFVSKLKKAGVYDSSLIVITADHGASFRANDSRRSVTKTNYADIMSIPLFIKAPYQKEGVTNDRNVETIDILPTVADVLDIPFPWKVDGHSMLDNSQPERREKLIFSDRGEKFAFDARLEVKYESLKRKLVRFNSGPWDRLFTIGPYPDLVGKRVAEIDVSGTAGMTVEVNGKSFFNHVDVDSSFVPAQITGRIVSNSDSKHSLDLAISVNNTIRAITRSSSQFAADEEFSAVVPESAFRSGENDVEVFVVIDVNGKPWLASTKEAPEVEFSISLSDQLGEMLISSNGKRIPVKVKDLSGWVGARIDDETDRVEIRGWAVDQKQLSVPSVILVFRDEELLYSGKTSVARPEIATEFGSEALLNSGFLYEFPVEEFDELAHTELRVFAVSDRDSASELGHPEKNTSFWPFGPNPEASGKVSQYDWDSTIRFGAGGNARQYQGRGWSVAGEGHTWTVGPEASLVLAASEPESSVLLKALVKAFLVSERLNEQRVRVSVNGQMVGEWTIAGSEFEERTVLVPAGLLTEPEKTVIVFETPDSSIPAQLGLGSDKRKLGIAFHQISLVQHQDR